MKAVKALMERCALSDSLESLNDRSIDSFNSYSQPRETYMFLYAYSVKTGIFID